MTPTLANSEHPDEMPHNAAFYQGVHGGSTMSAHVILNLLKELGEKR